MLALRFAYREGDNSFVILIASIRTEVANQPSLKWMSHIHYLTTNVEHWQRVKREPRSHNVAAASSSFVEDID